MNPQLSQHENSKNILSLLSLLTRVAREGGEACVGGWCGLCRRLVESWNGWVEEVVGGVEGV